MDQLHRDPATFWQKLWGIFLRVLGWFVLAVVVVAAFVAAMIWLFQVRR